MTLNERLKAIDDFFDCLTDKEFEKMCYECGAQSDDENIALPVIVSDGC